MKRKENLYGDGKKILSEHITITKKEEPETLIDKVVKYFDEYLDTTSAIIEDYVGGPGMTMELSVADKSLRNKILALEENTTEFEALLEKMNDLDNHALDPEKLIDLATNAYDFEAEHLLKHLDPGDIDDYATSNGFILIKVDNMNLRDKLETFIKTEILPNYNDQQGNLII